MNSPEFNPELTRQQQSGYAFTMEPHSPDNTSSGYEQAQPGVASEAAQYGRAMREMVNNGENLNETTLGAENDIDPLTTQAAKSGSRESQDTREQLVKISQEVNRTSSPGQVLSMAERVQMVANFLEMALQPKKDGDNLSAADDPYREVRDKFKEKNIFERAKELTRVINEARSLSGEEAGEQKPGQVSERARAVLRQANAVSSLAKEIADFYEKEQIAPEVTDPYKNIESFEELMIKFATLQTDERFRPGGEFSLIDVEERTDEFGRVLTKETAHPENFLRWIRERVQFYHDFDPMAPIDLFKNIYIVAGYHQVNLYQMTVDFDIYFAHRQPTFGDLYVTRNDLIKAQQDKIFEFDPSFSSLDKLAAGQDIGKYTYVDKNGQTKTATVKNVTAGVKREIAFGVFDESGKPIKAELADRDKWGAQVDKGFNEIKEDVLYEMWLMTYNHNMDVNYRQKGMPSEKTLNETMAELYSVNIWTRTRSRIQKMFDMASTTIRDENGPSESRLKMEGKLGQQGSVGKAFQRSLAAWYHIAEANASANGYVLDGSINPFKEVLRKGDIDGAEIFYKSIVRQGLEKKFGFKYDKNNPEKSRIGAELTHDLNETRIPRDNGSYRGRYEWEKADLYDVLLLGRSEMLAQLAKRGITEAHLNEVVTHLREKYGQYITEQGADGTTIRKNNPNFNLAKLNELDGLLTENAIAKRQMVFAPLEDYGFGKKVPEGLLDFVNGVEDAKGNALDVFAVKLFNQLYPKDFTPDLNPFTNISYSLDARDHVRRAMRDVLIQTEKLDDFEATYAEEWAYTMTYYTGISARNDMGGIGHDAWSKVLNTEYYRLRQTSGGNYYGNLENLYGIHRLGVDFWQGLKVQVDGSSKYDKTLYEILMGMDTNGNIDVNKDMVKYEFYGNAMRQFYADHLNHALELFVDLTQKHEFNLDKIIGEDGVGRAVINHAEMQKLIDSTWKHLRYAYDNRGFLYDSMSYGWWQDESFDTEKGKERQVKRKVHFGRKTLRELMFSEEIREMGMYYRNDVSGWSNTPENRATKMARNVFAYVIKAQIEEHTKRNGEAILYSADQISLFTDALMMYAARVIEGKHGEALPLSGFFSADEIYKMLVLAHAVLWKLYAKEYGKDFGGGLIAMLIAMMQVVTKEVGASITLGK